MISKSDLALAGFSPMTYEGQPGEFLSKTVPVDHLPYSSRNLIDNDWIFGDMLATTEVTLDGRVQLCVGDADYFEGPFPFDSEEGQALLKDAIAAGLEGVVPTVIHAEQ